MYGTTMRCLVCKQSNALPWKGTSKLLVGQGLGGQGDPSHALHGFAALPMLLQYAPAYLRVTLLFLQYFSSSAVIAAVSRL